MENQRSASRRRVFYYLEAWDIEGQKPIGRIGDVSENGIMLLTSSPLELNGSYHIQVKLPATMANMPDSIDIHIRDCEHECPVVTGIAAKAENIWAIVFKEVF